MARDYILENGIANENKLQEIQKSAEEEIESWVQFAKDSPDPDPSKATSDVYIGWEVEGK